MAFLKRGMWIKIRQYSIRGAITIEENTIENIRINTIDMLKQILKENGISVDDCVNLIFTATKDITRAYPAKFAREIGFVNCSLMCVQEMYVENSLEMCIRVMMTINKEENDFKVNHVYLKEAQRLRPDLIK